MRKPGLATIFLLFAAIAAVAQDRCTCLSTPYTPTVPCFEQCTVNLLETASLSQLQAMLRVSPDTAARIVDMRGSGGGASLEKYRLVLSQAEFKIVVDRANSLSADTLQEFHNNRLRSLNDQGMVPGAENAGMLGAAPSSGAPASKPRSRRRSTSRGALMMSGENIEVAAIKRLEEERNRALVAADVAVIDALYSDDYTSAVAGTFRTKAEVLADLKSGTLKLDASSNDETNVRVYGNTAVVTGKTTSKVTDHGVDTSGQSYFTRVYVNQKGRWRLVANHSSRLIS